MTKKYLFKVFLSGRTSQSKEHIANLKNFLEHEFKDEYSLEIIYVSENIQSAEHAKIFCTPTLIKELPPPPRRVIGDLADKEKVLAGLDLSGQ